MTPVLRNLIGGPTGEVTVNNQVFKVAVADTPERREEGLSGRRSLPENEGMIFLFDESSFPSFWMRGMHFPIDIIFLNDGTVTTIYENIQPPDSETAQLSLYKPIAPSNQVLELNAGKAKELGLTVGDTIEITLPER